MDQLSRRYCSPVRMFSCVAVVLFAAVVSLAQAPVPATPALENRVNSLLGQMTLEEKIDLLGGVDGFFIRAVPRVGLPRLKMADGPIGVRNFGPATAMAGGIGLAATWDPELAQRVGTQIGRDARAKGVHFLLGPGVNIHVAPMNGRNFEYFGEDPFLASRIAVGYINGVQSQGVSATIKHFMGNSSEFDRHRTDDIIDERTMREIYLPVFEAAVKEAHVGAIMDSYNLVNGEHLTQNRHLNTDIVKNDWGFGGIIMSDWGATYDGVAAANGGLDLEMPSGTFMNRESLLPALHQGKFSTATLDDKVRRILRTAIQFGWLDRDQTELSIPRYNLEGRQVALDAARESIVLLKNEGQLLPLQETRVKSVAIIGPDAYPAEPVGGGSARVQPFTQISFLEALSNALSPAATAYYNRGIPTLAELADTTVLTMQANQGSPGVKMEFFNNKDLSGPAVSLPATLHVGELSESGLPAVSGGSAIRWTGYYTPQSAGTLEMFVQMLGTGNPAIVEAGGYRLKIDDQTVIDSWQYVRALVDTVTVHLTAGPHKIVLEHYCEKGLPRARLGIARQDSLVDPQAKALAARADAVLVAVGFDPESESESGDRSFTLPIGQDELIREMAAANKNVIVVVTSGGSVDTRDWLDRVPALFEAWYPGQEGGTALAEILLGEVNPSGRLPISFERRWEDNPAHDSYYPEPGTRRVVYKDGVFVGYRGYEHNGTKPLFSFGYGLSYTQFRYANLAIRPAAPAASSGTLYEVSFDVTNTGTRAGADVPQIYIADTHAKVLRPAKELKAFSKVSLRPGETKRVTVPLDGRAFSYYDQNAKRWHADPGEFDVLVGRSSEQIELRGKLMVAAAAGGSGE